MEDILAADPQLAKELLFDIRQAEAARRAAAAAPASARPAPNAPPDTGGAAGPRWGAPRGSSLRTHRISSGAANQMSHEHAQGCTLAFSSCVTLPMFPPRQCYGIASVAARRGGSVLQA